MRHIAQADFLQNFDRHCAEAAQFGAIAVISDGDVAGYFVSVSEFEEFQRLRSAQRRSLWVSDLDDEMMAAIVASRMDPRHDYLNALLDDEE